MKSFQSFKNLAIAVLLFTTNCAMAQNAVTVVKKSGEIQQYTISDNGKMYFQNDNLMIQVAENANSVIEPLNNIAKLTFIGATDVDDIAIKDLSVFPNPTTDYLFIAQAKEGENVEIYAWNGMLIDQQNYSILKGISLKTFPNGLYIIRIANQSFKICKQ